MFAKGCPNFKLNWLVVYQMLQYITTYMSKCQGTISIFSWAHLTLWCSFLIYVSPPLCAVYTGPFQTANLGYTSDVYWY